MKVGIIAANNLRYSPYVYFYTDIMEHANVDYEIIVPDRNEGEDNEKNICCVLPWKKGGNTFFNYIRYAGAVKKMARQKKYDALIILTSNNAVFLAPWLKRCYRGKYIVDIRDYTHENILPYYWLQKKAVKNSMLNVISSPKFCCFLPKARYLTCHNITVKHEVNAIFEKNTSEQIDIGYVGALNYEEQCKCLISLVCADPRFRLSFYGSSDLEPKLKAFAEELDCERIQFYGRYDNNEKPGIIQKIDILFNAYGNKTPLLDYALSNKLYDAMAFRKPIITSPGTYMDELAGPMSYPIDLNTEQSLDGLNDWYRKLQESEINAYAQRMHQCFVTENEATCKEIEKTLKQLL